MNVSCTAKMDYKNRRGTTRRTGTVFAAIAVIVVVAAALVFYPSAPPTSDTVYCGILQYVEFPARTIVKGSTINITATMTTTVDYTTTTVKGPVGKTYSNATISTGTSGYTAGLETICKYIRVNSTST